MRVTTKITPFDLANIAESISQESYGGNVGVNTERMTLRAFDVNGSGARTGTDGEPGPWACWHAHRDVMAAWFDADPRMTIATGLATYRGASHFLASHEATGGRSLDEGAPALRDLCDCEYMAATVPGWRDMTGHVDRLSMRLDGEVDAYTEADALRADMNELDDAIRRILPRIERGSTTIKDAAVLLKFTLRRWPAGRALMAGLDIEKD